MRIYTYTYTNDQLRELSECTSPIHGTLTDLAKELLTMREESACAKTHVELLLSLLSRALRYVDNAPVGSAVAAGEVAALERQIRMALYLRTTT